MLKQLKRRFILINMGLVGITVLILFCTILVLNYRQEMRGIEDALDLLLQQTDETPHHTALPGMEQMPQKPQMGKDNMPSVFAIAVLVNDDGEILQQSQTGIEIDSELLSIAVKEVLFATEETGTLSDLNLIYKRQYSPHGIRIALTTGDHITDNLKNTALATGSACLLALIIFYFISRLLASIAIRPIQENWMRQKQFVADASHDLRTPLTVMLANTEVLRRHKDQTVGSQWQWIENNEREAERMKDLTGDLLALAQSEDALEKPSLQKINLSELSEQVVLQFEPVAFEKRIEISTTITPDIYVLGVYDLSLRLLYILLDNAIKYSERNGTVHLSLSLSGKSVTLSVCNRGTLIAEEDLPHVFERFYRSDRARSAGGGFGLGLAIAKNLVEAQNAKISVHSDAENGTVFNVLFR